MESIGHPSGERVRFLRLGSRLPAGLATHERLRWVGAVAVGIVAYNAAVGLVPETVRDILYVPTNLAFLGLLSLLVIPRTGLTREHLGLAGQALRRSASAGLAIGVVLPAPVFLLVVFPGLVGDGATDSRLAAAGLADFLYQAAVRIPLGTALFEELLFRGLLYGALLKASGHRAAILGSSVVFGLWHVRPTHELLTETEALSGDVLLGLAIGGGVLATFVGGLLFAWLRYKTGHVIGGVLAHGLINSLSASAVFLRG